ncbi:MAG: tRNA1(Val) (adenine(37)-N6)-methyltransferase [Desulforhopalus sp.]
MNTTNDNMGPAHLSQDSLFDGALVCHQHRKGYRFSIDAVLIAHFVTVRRNDRILDLGCGCGIIGLILLYRYQKVIREILGVELQDALAKLAMKNIQENGFTDKAVVLHDDIRNMTKLIVPESFDTIVCNPPFYSPESGRNNEDDETKTARHQLAGGLDDFLKAAAFAVKNRGSAYFIYPADQTSEFIHSAKQNRLETKKIQLIYSYPETNSHAKLAMFHCVKNGGAGVKISMPFFIYKEKYGDYSDVMQKYYDINNAFSSIKKI